MLTHLKEQGPELQAGLNERTAAALEAKGYHYRYVFGRGASHCDSRVLNATLADALIWIWRGYQPSAE